MASLRPDTDEGHDLGSSSKKWSTLYVSDVQAATATMSGNVEIQGNLTVTGTQTSLQVTTVEAEDPLIKLARSNNADTVDIGFYGLYNDGSDKYAGLFRDASDSGKFKLLDGVTSEPTTTVTGGSAATLVADVEGALTGNADTASSWATSRTVSFSGGDVSGSFSIDGSADVSSVNLTIGAGTVEDSMLAGSISDGKLASDYIQTSEVDDSSIEFSGGSLNVKALGVTNAMLAGSIENAKLSNSTVSFGGVQLSLGASDTTPAFDLQDATNYPASSLTGTVADNQLAQDYVQITEVDDSSIEWDGVGGHLQVKASGITNAMLAGSIENAKLSNSSVSFGGVSVSLGGSDGTPAFDLSDATNYPASSLSGTVGDSQLTQDYVQITEVDDSSIEWDGVGSHLQVKALGITNAMLAGSIENAKLSNSTVSFGGVQLSLGGSDASPAFDLSDATNYPASSLTGTLADNQLTQDYIQTSEVDGSSIEFSGGSLNVKALGVTNAMLAGSIDNSKLQNYSITFSDGSTTSAIDLGSQFTIQGTSNEVDVVNSAGVFTVSLPTTVSADLSGNASTATALQTARNIGITSGPVTAANVSFDGSGNVALTSAIADDQITNAMLANPSFTFTDGSNSEALELGSTLEFGGTSNEVEVAYNAAANKFTVGLPSSVNITSNIDVGGNATVSGALNVTGNVIASGQLTASGANISFADNLIEFGVNNTNAEDIGFYGQRGDGASGQGFAGFAWDESTDEFVAFTATSGNEPTDTVGTHSKAKIHASELESEGAVIGQLRMEGSVPSSDTDTGTAGDIRFDSGFIYVCTATDTWKRVAITGGF